MGVDRARIEKYKSRVEEKIKRNENILETYEKKRLSNYGYWSKGYYAGVVNTLENLLDDLCKLLEE